MSAIVTAPTLTSDTVLFRNKTEANTFFAGFTVPNATITTYGVVKTAVGVAYNPTQIDPAAIVLNDYKLTMPDGSVVDINAPDITHYQLLCAEVLKLQVALTAAITTLQNAGLMST